MSERLSPPRLAKEGQRLYKEGGYIDAAQSFEAAANGYRQTGNHLVAAEMNNNCCVALLKAGEADQALRVVADTVGIFEEAGEVKQQAMALGNRASALEALGRLEEAEIDYKHSADLLKQIDEEQLRLQVMQSLSALKLRKGKALEALVTMRSGVDDLERPKPRQRLLKRLLDIPFQIMKRQ
jgi:tetratricopeptide (TPR) repeat protein